MVKATYIPYGATVFKLPNEVILDGLNFYI